METKWFKGAEGEAVAFQCGANGIKLLKLATFFELKPITLQLNGVVVEPDSNGYVLLNGADFLNGLGGSSDDAIPVAGKPAEAEERGAAGAAEVTALRVAIEHLALEAQNAKASAESADARIEDLKGVIDALGVKVGAALQRRRSGKGKCNDWVIKAAKSRLPPIRETMPLT
jgi:hypothetical protein